MTTDDMQRSSPQEAHFFYEGQVIYFSSAKRK